MFSRARGRTNRYGPLLGYEQTRVLGREAKRIAYGAAGQIHAIDGFSELANETNPDAIHTPKLLAIMPLIRNPQGGSRPGASVSNLRSTSASKCLQAQRLLNTAARKGARRPGIRAVGSGAAERAVLGRKRSVRREIKRGDSRNRARQRRHFGEVAGIGQICAD